MGKFILPYSLNPTGCDPRGGVSTAAQDWETLFMTEDNRMFGDANDLRSHVIIKPKSFRAYRSDLMSLSSQGQSVLTGQITCHHHAEVIQRLRVRSHVIIKPKSFRAYRSDHMSSSNLNHLVLTGQISCHHQTEVIPR